MSYLENLYARRNQYASELVMAQAKLAVIDDVIADFQQSAETADNANVADEETVTDETY